MIDPTIRPASRRERETLDAIRAAGLSLTRRGAAIRLSGPGVDATVTTLGAINPTDLRAAVASLEREPRRG